MLGKGAPKLIKWERQKAPYANFGVLTFSAGTVDAQGGTEALESAAIVDIAAETLIGLPLSRKGQKAATWAWDENRLVVTSAEGLAEEFNLRGIKPGAAVAAAAPPSEKPAPSRREGSGSSGGSSSYGSSKPSGSGTPSWAPWAQNNNPSQPSRQQASRPQKPKSIFEMLFGN
jgi:hypothetical protein